MGKAAILLVLGSILTMSGVHQIDLRTELDTEDEQSFYQEKVLARENAMSALNIAVSNMRSSYDTYRISSQDVQQNGDYSLTTTEINENLVAIGANGYAGRAEYRIVGDMVRTGTALFSALTIDGPLSDASGMGADYQITGMDTMPSDGDGEHTGTEANTHGIHTTWESAYDVAVDGFNENSVYGIDGTGDFIGGPTELDLDQIAYDIMNHPDCLAGVPPCYLYTGDQRFTGNDTFGTPEQPAIVIVDGNVTFRGNVQGNGILYTTGDFKTEVGQPYWQGLIYANGVGATHELRGEPRIDGALVFRALDEDGTPGDLENPPPPMTVTVRGNVALNYSSYGLAAQSVLIPGLDSGTPEITLENVRFEAVNSPEKANL